MEYCFGPGDGPAMAWTAQPDVDTDGDGVLDGVSLDFDGDGFVDDALADLDGDGIAEHAVLDVDGEQRWFTDDGTGTWAVAVDRVSRDGVPLRWFSLDGAEHSGGADGGPDVDFDGDGAADDQLIDGDGDGLADQVRSVGPDGATGYVDTDGDGIWDVRLRDFDGDGAADAAAAL